MNPRYAAALALVGCYLLIPPLGGGKPDATAPLRGWRQFNAFDSAHACEQYRQGPDFLLELELDQQGFEPGLSKETARELRVAEASNSLCVSTDDARLKQKQTDGSK
jgi:hypothetical protein